jgi:glycosyltransferase involved in cell wall biosynthesis
VVEFAEVNGEGYHYLHQRRRQPVVIRCHTPTFVLKRYHTPEEIPYDIRLTERMEKYCIQHADALTAPSRDMARTIEEECNLLPDSVHAIPNALDISVFNHSPEHKTVSREGEEIIILHVGRLERVKGIETLAQAIPQVIEKARGTRFVFIGGARSEASQANWIRRLRASGGEHVSVLGKVNQAELLAWYRQAHIAVVPSLNYESFSYTCAQAMAAGLPVVASSIGGIPETLEYGKCGILIPPGDAPALAEALITLCLHPEQRTALGNAGLQAAEHRFAAEKIARQMSAIYQSLTQQYDAS